MSLPGDVFLRGEVRRPEPAGPVQCGRLGKVRAVAFLDQGTLECENLADQSAGLVAVVDDQSADADVEGEDLEVKVREAADPLGPVLAQGLLATDHAVTAEDAHRYR